MTKHFFIPKALWIFMHAIPIAFKITNQKQGGTEKLLKALTWLGAGGFLYEPPHLNIL